MFWASEIEKPADLAPTSFFLASDEASYVAGEVYGGTVKYETLGSSLVVGQLQNLAACFDEAL
jgi:NAD(P)-dependent dehydrogenase (short-subunit alcohol dehydrogenase family)